MSLSNRTYPFPLSVKCQKTFPGIPKGSPRFIDNSASWHRQITHSLDELFHNFFTWAVPRTYATALLLPRRHYS